MWAPNYGDCTDMRSYSAQKSFLFVFCDWWNCLTLLNLLGSDQEQKIQDFYFDRNSDDVSDDNENNNNDNNNNNNDTNNDKQNDDD